MEVLISYFLKVNFAFTILCVAYYIFFRRKKFLQLNRFVLLSISIVAFTLPCFPAPGFNFPWYVPEHDTANETLLISNPYNRYQVLAAVLKTGSAPFDVVNVYLPVAAKVYAVIMLLLFLRLILQLIKVTRIITRSAKQVKGNITYCTPAVNTPPFSFFKFIVMGPGAADNENYPFVMAHEQAHSLQVHSLDVLLTEIICVLLWINPISFLYRREVKLNLEYLADDYVLNSGADCKSYQINLLINTLSIVDYGVANTLYSAKIKQRISMMNTECPPAKHRSRYPLLALLTLILYLTIDPPESDAHSDQNAVTRHDVRNAKTAVPDKDLDVPTASLNNRKGMRHEISRPGHHIQPTLNLNGPNKGAIMKQLKVVAPANTVSPHNIATAHSSTNLKSQQTGLQDSAEKTINLAPINHKAGQDKDGDIVVVGHPLSWYNAKRAKMSDSTLAIQSPVKNNQITDNHTGLSAIVVQGRPKP